MHCHDLAVMSLPFFLACVSCGPLFVNFAFES